ncbi:dihydroxy-acid dehydratase [Citricoccus muralis]|uniref:Dihydroxy-acid dehydratase n=1 Tax=Citricoccus muralis TaxID=169134 RepID=A0ABY8H8U5_9MICC|nr:dihydroxy-acid dehydratase [Citricoccus muralis]WFP17125.1 dihydroxy-acid dehydratase [Citricoccus muralis]
MTESATQTLRSNFPVGSPRWATRRTQWRALGLNDEDIDKPKIAVVNSSSKLAPCFSHLDDIADRVCEVIRDQGAIPFEVRTVAPTDFMMAAGRGGGYVLSSRDLLTNDVEAVVEGAQLDGMICLASCDKTTPGQLMAAGRLNVPTVVVPCGYQRSGRTDDGEVVDIEEVFIRAGHVASGRCTLAELCGMSDRAIQGPGVCSGMGTANTMHIVSEALGMSLPGSAPVAANSPAMWRNVDDSARAIVAAVQQNLRPRDILTPAAFRNAVASVLAVSGSINAVKHLQAIAVESGLELDISAEFARLQTVVRPLSTVRPAGPTSIEEFDAAGGALAVLHQLGGVVDRSVTTVTGRSLGEILADPCAIDEQVIRPLDSPVADHATIQILHGSLAPHGAIVKLSATEIRATAFSGPAVVFEDAAAAIEAIHAQRIPSGSVLVVRGLGPHGTPGMGMASNVVFALDGAGLTNTVSVVTDGQLSGLVNKGIVVGEVKPEGARPGALNLVRDGDLVAIDLREGTVDLKLTPDELDARSFSTASKTTHPPNSWLSVYDTTATDLEHGATLKGASH